MNPITAHYIAGACVVGKGDPFHATTGSLGTPLTSAFHDATPEDVDAACRAAADAFAGYACLPLSERAALLESIADELDAQAEDIVAVAPRETGLPEPRIRGELARTTGQLRLFAAVVRMGDFLGARIDTADPGRQPLPKPDVRQYQVPLGPVAIFGASNFPLAFSVAGGDTASALASGCPVVVKAHPAHPGTSALAAAAVNSAVERSAAPAGVFSMLHGRGDKVGAALVRHPEIKAVGFTGSFAGGTALARVAAERPEPIPVFAEMGSVNPLFLLPGALSERAPAIAEGFVGSFTLGCGQFCTKPGIVFAPSGDGLERFLKEAARRIETIDAGVMLYGGLLTGFEDGSARLRETPGIHMVAKGRRASERAQTQLYRTTTETLRKNPDILDEIFGPVALVIEIATVGEMVEMAKALPGQLTAAIHGTEGELARQQGLIDCLTGRAGRILCNGYPTGVEVCHAMVHGGPFPATTDSRMSSVGSLAIDRFMRPVCYQDFPQSALPAALRDGNPLNLRRLIDGRWEQ